MLRAAPFASLVILAVTAACGDDTGTTGAGSGGGGTAASTASSTTTASSTAATTTSGVGGSGGDAAAGGSGGNGAGGTGGSGSGGAGGGATAQFEVAWPLRVGPESVDCFFLGAETVEIRFERADAEPVFEKQSCFDESATTEPMPTGDYDVTATLFDFQGWVVLESEPVAATLEEGGTSIDVEIAAPGARLSATWSIVQGDLEATWEDAGATHAEVLLYDLDTARTYGGSFACPLGAGTTGYFPLGRYDVSVNLLEFDVVLVSSEIWTVELQEPDETFVLPEAVFDLGG